MIKKLDINKVNAEIEPALRVLYGEGEVTKEHIETICNAFTLALIPSGIPSRVITNNPFFNLGVMAGIQLMLDVTEEGELANKDLFKSAMKYIHSVVSTEILNKAKTNGNILLKIKDLLGSKAND